MNAKKTTDLSAPLQGFFNEYLRKLKGTSPHTILSYRDSLKLLLLYLAKNRQSVARLSLDDIDPDRIIGFLDYLETERQNSTGTRNVRLAAIHSFFRYLASVSPEHLCKCQQILGIPFKRTLTREIEYLEFDEISAVLEAIDRTTAAGIRDYALLLLMFNTGARAQEIVDLRICNLSLSTPFSVRIIGKGNKERTCPIWKNTARILNQYIDVQGATPGATTSLFFNRLGTPLSRFGIRYILNKYIQLAAAKIPALGNKRLHPHSMRHSTAVHLLKSGVDLVSIANWLGHSSPNTTNKYATMDLAMKREIIEKASPPTGSECPWHQDQSLLTWLEAL